MSQSLKPKVFICWHGETGQGGSIDEVFNSQEKAEKWLEEKKNDSTLPFADRGVKQPSVNQIILGCDWYAWTEYEVD